MFGVTVTVGIRRLKTEESVILKKHVTALTYQGRRKGKNVDLQCGPDLMMIHAGLIMESVKNLWHVSNLFVGKKRRTKGEKCGEEVHFSSRPDDE